MKLLNKSAAPPLRWRLQASGIWAAAAVVSSLVLASSVSGQDPVQYRIYVSNEYSADVTVIDPRTNEVIGTIPISGRPGDVRPRGMAVSADGTLIYIAVSDFNPEFETSEDKIVAIDVRTNEVVREFRAGGNPERLALSPDGERIWASLEALARAAGYNVESGQQFAGFIVGVEAEGIAISPDGH